MRRTTPEAAFGRAVSISILGLMTLLGLAPAGALAQPAPIPIDELTAEQYESLAAEQVIVWPGQEMTLGELRAKEAERRAAHAAAVEKTREWASRELEAHEAARLERRAAEARAADQLVMDVMTFTGEITAADPEAISRVRERAAARRAASALRREALAATSERELARIERELARLARRFGD